MDEARRHDALFPLLTVLTDALAIESAFLLAYTVRFHTALFESFGFIRLDAPAFDQYLEGSAITLLAWLLLFQARGMYGARRNVTLSDELFNILRVISQGMVLLMSAAFFYRGFSYSRIVFGLLWGFSIFFVFSARSVIRAAERRLYRKGRHLQPAVIVGNDALADQVYTQLHRHASFGFEITGYFSATPAPPGLTLARVPHLGPVTAAADHLRATKVDLCFIALRSRDNPQLFHLVDECEGLNVRFMMVPDLLEVLSSRVRVHELEGIPFLELKRVPLTTWGRVAKRTFDLAVASTGLVVTSPLMAAIALLIKMESRGPVLFRQERIGLDGRSFTMLKFRSMKTGSESADGQAGLGIRGDPRRTRLGAILRKTSLDELPQLFNVLRGDMSLVGPRPERVRYVEEFGATVPKYLDRHRVKTGVTGWAQVNGLRGDTSIEDRIKYDLYYIENWSLAFDIKILLRTFRAALSFKNVD